MKSDSEKLRAILDELAPPSVPNYNMGLLPDEEGYNPEFVAMRLQSEERKDQAEAALTDMLREVRRENIGKQINEYLSGERQDTVTMVETCAMLLVSALGLDTNATEAEVKLKDLKWRGELVGTWAVTVQLQAAQKGTQESE